MACITFDYIRHENGLLQRLSNAFKFHKQEYTDDTLHLTFLPYLLKYLDRHFQITKKEYVCLCPVIAEIYLNCICYKPDDSTEQVTP